MIERPRVLIEDWLPIAKIGAESQRERGASSALPPLYFLHVWWARRPLAVSRAAILGSLLPTWSPDWPTDLRKQFPTRGVYYEWFTTLLGIFGDPAQTRRAITYAREKKLDLGPNPYGYARAFTYNPSDEQMRTLRALLMETWGTADPKVVDTFAGGGSIPFESLRYGFTTYANELNPVASTILKATLDFPSRYREKLVPLIRRYGDELAKRVRARLDAFFPESDGERVFAYLWARTVACKYTGKPIPLSPNWWLLKGEDPVAIQPVYAKSASRASFRVVHGKAACDRVDPDKGTVRKGNAVSPWADSQAIDGDYIKAEAQSGRMGQQLFCVGLKRSGGVEFRAPLDADEAAIAAAERELTRLLPRWEATETLPDEAITETSNYDRGHRLYGMFRHRDLFTPRQLLAHGTSIEILRELRHTIEGEHDPEVARAVLTYLGFAIDKSLDYNSRMTRWHSGRGVVVNTFDKHSFSLKWSFAEFDAAHSLLPWAVDQVADATGGIVKLIAGDDGRLLASAGAIAPSDRLHISRGTATAIESLPARSVGAVVVDPPYYDNVMYAECSDFFYVWQKRSLGAVYPGWFDDALSNKDDEAVANRARFRTMGRKKKELAEQDYERKMEGCFREMQRVLRDDGVLTVMFTHKKVEAWNTLGSALISAGFAIHASWPVHTESEHSTHQAKKNAAASTILLTCRKRTRAVSEVWWDDLKQRVRETAREKAAEYEKAGIRGVDLYIATFGPVLAVVSENWPVLTSEVDPKTGKPKTLRPEAALEIARAEVVALRRSGLLLGRDVKFDPVTDWYLMAWDAFRAEAFPADEARKLSIALGLDLEKDLIAAKRIVGKKSASVVLQAPAGRRKRGCVDPDAETFECTLDAAHTAMLVFEEDGARACERWLRQRGLEGDVLLKALWQAMVNALPTAKKKGAWIRPEMAMLDRMNDALSLGVRFPKEEDIKLPEKQAVLGKWTAADLETDEDDEEGEDDDSDEEDGE